MEVFVQPTSCKDLGCVGLHRLLLLMNNGDFHCFGIWCGSIRTEPIIGLIG
jgi:hypothetical protein